MAYGLQDRSQQGAPYFESAKRFENRLPVKERSQLDTVMLLDSRFHPALSFYSDIYSRLNKY
ncbi:MAG: hypothetical protein JSV44_09815, partial [Candidatus Zixiibacteriota bacterium]